MSFSNATILGKENRLWFMHSVVAVMLFFCFSISFAQTDTSQNRYKLNNGAGQGGSNIDLKNPVGTEWKYNAKTNMYEEYRTLDGMNYPTGNKLTLQQYYDKVSKDDKTQYYKEKGQSSSYNTGNKTRGDIKDYLNNKLENPYVSKIFGEGGVDFQLSGSAMLKIGGNFNVNRNPNFSKRQQKYFVPMFDQQIQISANGKVGQYVKLGINYDTESQFEFDNQTNLGWNGKPTGLLKDVQIGNVSLNLPTQLIKPSPALFGFSNTMKFGKTKVTTVFSQNKGQNTETVLQGGQQLNEFRFSADNYDQNRHFFLSQFFRDNYDNALSSLPLVQSGVVVTRVEVWVTNRNASVETPRDVLCFQDLGEAKPFATSINGGGNPAASNDANDLWTKIKSNPNYRKQGSAQDLLLNSFNGFEQGQDFDILQNARALNESEFTLNKLLGYISLAQPLNNDEILAVAYEYTFNGQVYQVGEFSRESNNGNSDLLFLKMLKGNTIRITLPIWDLMMKNIYALNTYNLTKDDFKMNVIYADDTSGADYNYIPNNDVATFANGNPLLKILGLDRLNRQEEPKPDGVMDLIEGITINTQQARIIFPVVEPFGKFMRDRFAGRNDLADYYCFQSLYDSTKWLAQQDAKHNKFFLVGSYKSPNGAEIFLGTSNLQPGSVRVTANGRPLTEGFDYEVDYSMGRVTIKNQGLLQGGAEIRASANGQSFFNIQQKTLVGGRIEHQFSKNIIWGGTALHMWERPLTSNKTNFGEEPILNTIVGTDFSYSANSRWLTKMIDRLPFLETKEVSRVTGYFEFAQLFAHNHKSQGGQRGISNVDDFENAELPNDYKMVTNWVVSSIPLKQPDLFPETQQASNRFHWLDHAAQLNFYTIDPVYYNERDVPKSLQSNMTNVLANHFNRQITQDEVFKQRQLVTGTPNILPTLDLVFDPFKRGQYNFNVTPGQINADGELVNPRKSWAGIMRRVDQNDFEAANIDYIEMWIMNPMHYDNTVQGDMYLNLGSVSEDVLPDGRKGFENGLPESITDVTSPNLDSSIFGRVSVIPQINNAFDSRREVKSAQDIGLDGLNDEDERSFFQIPYLQQIATNFGTASKYYQNATVDPANDNFIHHLDGNWDNNTNDIVGRYQKFNGMQGNSSKGEFSGGQYNGIPNSSSPLPNDEDVNRDFSLNQSEDYFQYKIPISSADLVVGKGYVTDMVEVSKTLNGQPSIVRWYQLKIPVRNYQKAVGNISDFKSIRFMRLFVTNFNKPCTMRIGYINLVRADWRRHPFALNQPGAQIPIDPNNNTKFIVSTVNLEENGERVPQAYVMPPGIARVQNMATLGTVRENEQALSLAVLNLKPGDARGAFKISTFDIRNYKRLQMFVHAEPLEGTNPRDGDATVFIRFGTDLISNYYEYEVPLKFTRGIVKKLSEQANASELIWPDENFIDLEFEELIRLKIKRVAENWPMTAPYGAEIEKGRISVLGLPDLSNIRSMMIGIKNKSDIPMSIEIWTNELRVKDINNKNGWAALGNIQTQLADLGQLNAAGSIRTIGFGDVDKKLQERNLTTNINYDVSTNLELGRFFPKKMEISLPIYLGYSETYIIPKYYPLNPDIELKTFLNGLANKEQRKQIREAAIDFNSLYSFNLNNFRLGNGGGKNYPWSLNRFTGGYGFQRTYRRNQQIQEYFLETTNIRLEYTYGFKERSIEPFKKIKSKFLKPLAEFNFNLLPTNMQVQGIVVRTYSENQARNNNNFKQINPRFYDKNFTMERIYNLTLPLTKSININYNAQATARFQEPLGAIDTEAKKDSLRAELRSFGRPVRFAQRINASYELPFSKFRALDWINGSITYTGSYQWDQAPPAISSLGNTIQNAREISGSVTLNFTSFYNKFQFFRELEKPKSKKKNASKPGEKGKEGTFDNALEKAKKDDKANPSKLFFGRFVSMIKNVNINYSQTEKTMLPGFKFKTDYFGHNFLHKQPGIPFTMGWQEDNIRFRLANFGALNNDPRLNNFYVKNLSEVLGGTATVEPVKDFRINLDFNRTKSTGFQSVFRWDEVNQNYNDFTVQENGQYSITGIFIKTLFIKDQKVDALSKNETFNEFRNSRFYAAEKLSMADGRVQTKGIDPVTQFPNGYSANSQDVLVGSFYNVYSGKAGQQYEIDAFPKIPLPNWNINYNGLTRIKAIGKVFSNISIRHAYTGRYTVGGYQRNLQYDANASFTQGQDFVPKYQIADLTITDGFSPLIGINVSTQNNWTFMAEYKKMRTVRLFAAQANINENRNNDFTFSAGYRIAGLTLPFRHKGRRVYLPNDLRFDMQVSIMDNLNVVRRIENNVELRQGGLTNIRISPNLNYQINQKLTASLRYNRMVMRPKMDTQFFTALTDIGFEIRYTLN